MPPCALFRMRVNMASEANLGGRYLRVRLRYKRIGGSYWFRPLILIVLGVILSQITLYVDELIHNLGFNQLILWWIFKASPLDAAIDSLTGTATVLLGLFGVLLSLALIPLTIATSSYGNVVLSNFIRDKGTQNVIGYFAFVIFFDISAAISLPIPITGDNYPGVTLTLSIVFVAGALIATVYFFNHVANLLQATYLSKSVTDELMKEIEISYAGTPIDYNEGQLKEFDGIRKEISEKGALVRSKKYGYVAGLNYQSILNKARRGDAIVLVLKLPGDYVAIGEPLVKYIAKGRIRENAFNKAINSAYSLGVNRTVMQDIDYGVQQLAIIAARALSPAVNDPITATICIDKIGQVLSKVVAKPARSSYILGKKGELRLIADPDDFRSLMATGFNQIRQYGNKAYEVMVHALYAIETIAYAAERPSDRRIIKCHADMILKESLDNLTSDWSKEQVKAAYDSTIQVIESGQKTPTEPTTPERRMAATSTI
jgi:uncharacterized membrane protein